MVVAEGAHYKAISLADYFQKHNERLGAATTWSVADGQFGGLMGLVNGEVIGTARAKVVSKQKPLDPDLLGRVRVLAK